MPKEFYDPTKPFGEQIRKIIVETHPPTDAKEIQVRRVGKRYEISRDYKVWANLKEMTATDGTGTKGKPIWDMKAFDVAGDNPFAMAVDDLYEGNYEPFKLQDHLILQEEDKNAILTSINSLKNLCIKFGWVTPLGTKLPIIIDGGETAICNTIDGMEFAVTATGYARPEDVLEAHAEAPDALIGLGSNDLQSNGFTFVRYGLFDVLKMGLDDKFDFGPTVGEELVKPTRIYLGALRDLNKELGGYVTGKVHITGGGLSKLRELSNKKNAAYEVFNDHSLAPQPIFHFIREKLDVPENKMLTRFNCGIGYVVAVKDEVEEEAVAILRRHYPADIIGKVRYGPSGKIEVHSPFSDSIINL